MKILVSRPDKIGDVVLALHGIKQLKKLLPEAKVYVHASEYTLPLVSQVKFLDGAIRVGEDLRPHKFDVVVDLIAKSYTAFEYFRAGIPIRIGNRARWFSLLYNRTTVLRRSFARMNEAEYNWEILARVDKSLNKIPLDEELSVDDFAKLPTYAAPRPFVILMPGVSVSASPWEISKWLTLASHIVRDTSLDVLFLGGPAEERVLTEIEAALAEPTSQSDCMPAAAIRCVRCHDIAGVLSIMRVAHGYVGPSTGPTHLASVARVPGVALYPARRSMHPRRWQPFRSSLRIQELSDALDAPTVFNALKGAIEDHAIGIPARGPLSAFIICVNEERNIRRALDSIKWCDQILIVDSGSTDQTLAICREYPRTHIIERDWPGHRAQKQFALQQCKHEWILNIDADEEISPKLRAEIENALYNMRVGDQNISGFELSRVVRFLHRWWDKGGWFPEYRLRLFRKSRTHWGGVDPHEKAICDGPTVRLQSPLFHFTYHDIKSEIQTLNNFSSRSAAAFFAQGKRTSFYNLILNPLMRFIKFYFFKKGFLEGRAGFIVACNEAFYTFMKYAKIWELTHIAQVETLGSQTLLELPSEAPIPAPTLQPVKNLDDNFDTDQVRVSKSS